MFGGEARNLRLRAGGDWRAGKRELGNQGRREGWLSPASLLPCFWVGAGRQQRATLWVSLFFP